MRYFVVFAGFIGILSGAQAQTTTQTDCWNAGFGVTCRSQTQPPGPTTQDYLKAQPNYWQNFQAGQQMVNETAARQRAAEAAAAQAQADRQTQALSSQVGQLVAAGKCDQALDMALAANDLILAKMARDLCRK